ncbi:MAG: 50S ribosomal protein L29 [Patescibacteria group bacterium]
MKRKEFNDMKLRPVAELEKLLGEYRTKLRDLEFDLAAGKVKNIKEMRVVKKSIAQLLTLVRAGRETNTHA